MLLAATLLLTGCTGLRLIGDGFAGPRAELPMLDSLNMRRASGTPSIAALLRPQEGNIWPGPQASEPLLSDLAYNADLEARRGFVRSVVPGTVVPGASASQQPGPVQPPEGPATLPLSNERGTASRGLPLPPASSVPVPGPTGQII